MWQTLALSRRSSGEDPVGQLCRPHVTTVDTVDIQPAYRDGGTNLLDRDLDAVNTVDIPAVNQGYGILNCRNDHRFDCDVKRFCNGSTRCVTVDVHGNVHHGSVAFVECSPCSVASPLR